MYVIIYIYIYMYKDLYVYNTWDINRENIIFSTSRSLVENLGFQDPAGWVHNDQQDFVHLEGNLGRKDSELSKVIGGAPKIEKWMAYDGKSHENPMKIDENG